MCLSAGGGGEAACVRAFSRQCAHVLADPGRVPLPYVFGGLVGEQLCHFVGVVFPGILTESSKYHFAKTISTVPQQTDKHNIGLKASCKGGGQSKPYHPRRVAEDAVVWSDSKSPDCHGPRAPPPQTGSWSPPTQP